MTAAGDSQELLQDSQPVCIDAKTNTVESFRQYRTVEDMAEYNPLARRTRAKHTSQWLLRKSGRELLVYHSAWDKPYSQKNTMDASEVP